VIGGEKLGNTYTCDGCGTDNLNPLVNVKTSHWENRFNTSNTKESRTVLFCAECESKFDATLQPTNRDKGYLKPEFKAKSKTD